MKKRVLITIVLCVAVISVQTIRGFIENEVARKASGAVVTVGGVYLMYKLLTTQTPDEVTRDVLDQYRAAMELAIKLKYQAEDIGKGYCVKTFNEIKPALGLLRKKTVESLERQVKALEEAFSADDQKATAQAYKQLKQCIEIDCEIDLEREARLRQYNLSYIEKLQQFFGSIGHETCKLFKGDERESEATGE